MRIPPPTASGILLLVLLSMLQTARAQNCYYPNGGINDKDAACSSSDSACCPLNWECLSNGLCYYAEEEYFERHTCTDQTWESSECPQYCTQNGTAAGNEAISHCSDGSWCCDGDRVSIDCCTMKNAEKIDVPGWTTVGTITSVPPTLSVSSETATTSTRATTPSVSSATSDSSSSTTKSPDSTTFPTESISSDSTGGTMIVTATIATTAPTSAAMSSPSHNTSKELAIGLGIGLPVLVLAGALCAFLLWKRKKKNEPSTSDRVDPDKRGMVDMYAHSKNAQEADGMPVAVSNHRDSKRPISELSGSNRLAPTQHSPAVSNTSSMDRFSSRYSNNGIEPPTYTPGSPANINDTRPGELRIVNGGPLSDVAEHPEPQELPPEGNPPRDSRYVVPPPPPKARMSNQSGYEAYGRAYDVRTSGAGPVPTTYVPSPTPEDDEARNAAAAAVQSMDEMARYGNPQGSRPPQHKKRNDELMLD